MPDHDPRDTLPLQEADDVGDRIHVCVGATCNNNCVFCMEDDRDDRFARVVAQTPDDVARMIRDNRGTREILFTSGEPTLNEHLPDYVRLAREAGYPVIGVISNGRRFAYAPYLKTLLDAGMNNVIVSIHGHEARVHDTLTRARGSFDQALRGLRNLDVMRRAFDFRVATSTVVNRRNLPHLGAICAMFAPLAIDRHVFNVMMPEGWGATNLATLMPRYRDVTAAFAALLPALTPGFRQRIAVVDIPYCTTEGLPDAVRGYVERYFHYEPDGSFERRADGMERQVARDDDDRLFQAAALAGERTAFTRVTRTFQETFVRAKRPECARCGYDAVCRGVWKPYVARFGWDEMVPVTRPSARVPEPVAAAAPASRDAAAASPAPAAARTAAARGVRARRGTASGSGRP